MEFLIYRASEYKPLSEYKLEEAGFKFKELKYEWDTDLSRGIIYIKDLDELLRLNEYIGHRLVVGRVDKFDEREYGVEAEIQIYDYYLE